MEKKYVIFSDMHRGVGDYADECYKNRDIIIRAYQNYLDNGFTLIENGDCEELYENRSEKQIWATYKPIYRILEEFNNNNKLIIVTGNHDAKRKDTVEIIDWGSNTTDICFQYKNIGDYCEIKVGNHKIRIEHGHRMSKLFHFPKLECWLVRNLWRPINKYGITDKMYQAYSPISTLSKDEDKLNSFFKKMGYTDLIIGHTHQSKFSPVDGFYNIGSAIHPSFVQCIEVIENDNSVIFKLCKWYKDVDDAGHVMFLRDDICTNIELKNK